MLHLFTGVYLHYKMSLLDHTELFQYLSILLVKAQWKSGFQVIIAVLAMVMMTWLMIKYLLSTQDISYKTEIYHLEFSTANTDVL